MKRIIEQIEGLKKNNYDDKQIAVQFAFEGYNQAIDDVLDSLNVAFELLPHPTYDGWWFAMRDNKVIDCIYIEIESNGDYYVPVTVDIDGEVEWIKAIMPGSEG